VLREAAGRGNEGMTHQSFLRYRIDIGTINAFYGIVKFALSRQIGRSRQCRDDRPLRDAALLGPPVGAARLQRARPARPRRVKPSTSSPQGGKARPLKAGTTPVPPGDNGKIGHPALAIAL
jgi:hypothetical protein